MTWRRLGTCRPASLLTWNFDTRMSPWVGDSSASSSRMNVDLPEPDGPMRKTNSPLSILTDTLSSAGRADDLYCLDTWSRVIIGYLRRGSTGFGKGSKQRFSFR